MYTSYADPWQLVKPPENTVIYISTAVTSDTFSSAKCVVYLRHA